MIVQEQKLYFLEKINNQREHEKQKKINQVENNDNSIYRQMKNRLSQKKIYCCGGFLQKAVNSQSQKYFSTQKETPDLLTLIRNLILIRLSQQGFQMRSFLSSDGESIYTVLYSSERNLQIQAELSKMPKLLNIEFTDLLSLEPSDRSFRPLRLNNRIWRPNEYSGNQISEYFLYLRPKIKKLIEEINFKKMAREVNIQGLNEQLFADGKEDILQDHESPNDETWTAFYEYLNYVKDRVEYIRKKFQFDNDKALLINNQKEPRDLYIIRNKKKILNKNKQDDLQEINTKVRSQKHHTTIKASPSFRKYSSQDEDKIKLNYQNELEILDLEHSIQEQKQSFKTLREILDLKENKQISTKHMKERMREILAYEYGNVLKDAIVVGNYGRKRCLKNIWEHLEMELFESTSHYFVAPKSISFKRRRKVNTIWKKYEITENGRISIFSTMERLKLVDQQLQQTINVNFLVEKEIIQKVFVLNDDFELIGQSRKNFYSYLFEEHNMELFLQQTQVIHFNRNLTIQIDNNINVQEQSINNNLLIKKDRESSQQNEFFDLQQKVKISPSNQNQNQIMLPDPIDRNSMFLRKLTVAQNEYSQQEYYFVQEKLKNLKYLWRFRKLKPWYIPVDTIRNYYGEKIALYFAYLSHYTGQLISIGLIGILIVLIQSIVNEDASYILGIIFSTLNIQWIYYMIGDWSKKEILLSAKYGQFNKRNTVHDRQEQRTSFVGIYRRSPINDNLNTQNFPQYKIVLRMLMNLFIALLVFSIYEACVYGLFQLSSYFDEKLIFSNIQILRLEVTVPALINVILILIFDEFYEILSVQLTQFENHPTVNDFESNFIIKKFFLQMLSYAGPLFYIGYLSKSENCAYKDCYLHAKYYFTAIFFCLFLLNIYEIVKPMLLVFLAKGAKYLIKIEELTQLKQHVSKESSEREKDKISEVGEEKSLLPSNNRNPFFKINTYIEHESIKPSYVISADRYGTIDDYMEITIQLALLALFGSFAPETFFVALIWNIIEMQTDRDKLIKYMQRPIPKDESSIGIWYQLLGFISNVSVLQNAGIMLFQGSKTTFSEIKGVGFFLFVLFLNFFGIFFQTAIV